MEAWLLCFCSNYSTSSALLPHGGDWTRLNPTVYKSKIPLIPFNPAQCDLGVGLTELRRLYAQKGPRMLAGRRRTAARHRVKSRSPPSRRPGARRTHVLQRFPGKVVSRASMGGRGPDPWRFCATTSLVYSSLDSPFSIQLGRSSTSLFPVWCVCFTFLFVKFIWSLHIHSPHIIKYMHSLIISLTVLPRE
jgi:hypothetical protein